MNIQELRVQHRAKLKEARGLYRKITDDTPEKEARKIERDFYATLSEADDIHDQIEEAKEARSDDGDHRRPRGDDKTVDGSGNEGDARDAAFGLKPEDRVTTWAQAKQPDKHNLTLGQYLGAMVRGAKSEAEKRALAEGTDSAGGYTVPTMLSAQLIDLLRASSVAITAGARTVPLGSDNNNIAKLASDPVPAWRVENAVVAESDPTFTNVPLVPRSLAVLTKVSRELFQDTLNLDTELPRILATALAKELDRVALLGSGTAPEPEGIANMTGIGTTAHDAALTTYAPFVAARTGILSANAGPISAIIMHPRDEGTLTGLTDSTGQPLMAPKAVADIPLLTTTAIPADGGAGSDESTIFLGNFAHLMVGIRSEIRVEVLKERYADNYQYGLLAHMRADIAAQHEAAFHTITGVQG
ncbi:phage major capsid protein [Pukyongiella litopenaei]|nr:phage major capsid protein [Pukyongiella litopenaei]